MHWAVTNLGRETDNAFIVIAGICVLLFLLIISLTVYFTVRYRRSRSPVATDIEGNNLLEVLWTVVPIFLVIFMFYYGWLGYDARRRAPEDAFTIKAFGQMWRWSFEYDNGVESDTLNLPAGRPVKVVINSRDVLHSLFIPAFRVKQDAVPGLQRTVWFIPESEGAYDLFCAEYCGTGHSHMITKAIVMGEKQWGAWMKDASSKGVLSGAELLKSKGCLSCHTIDGTPLVGPTLKGIFGAKVKVTTNGKEREVVVDEEYIRRSELEPAFDIVVGYPPVMPPQKGVLKDEEIGAIVEYIKTLK